MSSLSTLTFQEQLDQFPFSMFIMVIMVAFLVVIGMFVCDEIHDGRKLAAWTLIGLGVSNIGAMILISSQEQIIMTLLRILFGHFDVAWMFLVALIITMMGAVVSLVAMTARNIMVKRREKVAP
jgi:hypothetical protein